MQEVDMGSNYWYRQAVPDVDVKAIESFHLLFLQAVTAHRNHRLVLKGGANLRYFFGSPRYSNDIDVDFAGQDGWRMGDGLDKVLEGAALASLVRQAGLEVVEVTNPKRTETTMRWKIGLARVGRAGVPIRTKIELSARPGASQDIALERVPDAVVAPYGQMSPVLLHYEQTAAIEQKIAALALRGSTKARDVFDLDLLLRRRTQRVASPPLRSEHADLAAGKARAISYPSFRSEVLPFLDPDVASLYQAEDVWDHMRDSVAARLERIAGTDEGRP